ncbi:MAG: EF-hand domain-containing protein, partial [Deltaproteobacteria bacterium]|nr:EF-hand domain-containing protein [Deltaproteobacteria bacterium]
MKHIIKSLSIVSALALTGFAADAAAAPGGKHHSRKAKKAKMLAKFDANGDGQLTGSEKTQARRALRKMKAQRWNKLIAKADLNGDGAISKA